MISCNSTNTNFGQIGTEMAILAHLTKLTDQLTNQPIKKFL